MQECNGHHRDPESTFYDPDNPSHVARWPWTHTFKVPTVPEVSGSFAGRFRFPDVPVVPSLAFFFDGSGFVSSEMEVTLINDPASYVVTKYDYNREEAKRIKRVEFRRRIRRNVPKRRPSATVNFRKFEEVAKRYTVLPKSWKDENPVAVDGAHSRAQAIRLASSILTDGPSRHGGLHAMLMEGLRYNRTLEEQRIGKEATRAAQAWPETTRVRMTAEMIFEKVEEVRRLREQVQQLQESANRSMDGRREIVDNFTTVIETMEANKKAYGWLGSGVHCITDEFFDLLRMLRDRMIHLDWK